MFSVINAENKHLNLTCFSILTVPNSFPCPLRVHEYQKVETQCSSGYAWDYLFWWAKIICCSFLTLFIILFALFPQDLLEKRRKLMDDYRQYREEKEREFAKLKQTRLELRSGLCLIFCHCKQRMCYFMYFI